MQRQREFNSYHPHTPLTDTSDLEDDGNSPFGSYKKRTKKYHHDQFLTVPSPSWRINTKTPHDIPPRVKSPGSPDITSAGEYGSYEDSRFILGQTSPRSPASPTNSPPLGFSPPRDRVYRKESNLRSSPEYITSSFYHPQPQRQNQAVKVYSYWWDGEIRYEDQWGTRVYPRENGSSSGTSGGDAANNVFTRSVWVDDMAIELQGGKLAAIPGGRLTYGEQGLRGRGIRR